VKQVIKGLEGLDGVKKAESGTYDAGVGTFVATVDEKRAVTFDQVKGSNKFTLDWAELTIAGDVEKGDAGLTLKARGSGAKYTLRNRAKKEGEKDPPDVVAQIETLLKDGRLMRVKGRLTKEEKTGEVLSLESAEAIKGKK